MNGKSDLERKSGDMLRRDFLKTAAILAAFPFPLNGQNKTMNKYGLYGKLQAKAGRGQELGEILLKAAKLMENAKGCHLYLVGKEVDNPDGIYIIEVWESKADHDDSLKAPGVRELITQAMPLLDGNPAAGMTLEILGGKGLK
jgi:quinol monooxygenase YgiN